MTIDFTCQKCEGSFELDTQDMVDGTEKLECPHCGVKAPQTQVDDFIAAFTEMQAQVTALGKRFAVAMSIETDEVDDDDEDEDEDDYVLISCNSKNNKYKQCPIRILGHAELVRQKSRNACRFNKTWGYDRRGVWVSKGCRAEFAIYQ